MLDVPDPQDPYPLGDARCVFLRPVLGSGSIVEAGEYTYYDASEDKQGFEEEHVLYAFGTERLRIGRFCSIASGVRFLMPGANHIYTGPSTFPFLNFAGDWQETLLDLLIERELPGTGDTVIGDDVWIGRDAVIMPGVTVGQGAVIGTRAVCARDVAPYEVVVGNPARAVRSRYDAAGVRMLLAARWWDWPVDVLTRHVADVVLGTPERLVDIARAEGLLGGETV